MYLFFSCKTEENKLQKPSFLIGNWIQVNRTDSLTTFENWNEDYEGIGLTLNKRDTTFFERMQILEKDSLLYLKVSGVNKNATYFKFTSQTDSSFTAENSINEFPKKIRYYFEYNSLKADVSNEETSLNFVFEKRK